PPSLPPGLGNALRRSGRRGRGRRGRRPSCLLSEKVVCLLDVPLRRGQLGLIQSQVAVLERLLRVLEMPQRVVDEVLDRLPGRRGGPAASAASDGLPERDGQGVGQRVRQRNVPSVHHYYPLQFWDGDLTGRDHE